ncbi:beta/gamma crystallin domain-containing protein 1 [Globicephala melas]|uniref:beta/gamma crystallin domain-containing protein 1 n=1 Tax=Globicephala melas TaxID=9731 RepID=UPI00293D6AF6|nr:beta/gamma crystallin domain-containing protein 1 [Globicephala melas]
MPLSLPPQGDHGESSPSRTPKKHASFHIWRSKKKQQPPRSDCGVFIPHPPPASFGEARALEVVDGGHVAGECQEFTLHCGESRFFHTACEVPGPLPTESGMFKKSSAQPPEENKRKPVLGKLGTLFTAGRRRNTRNGLESPTSSNAVSVSPKEVTSSKLPETETEKSQLQGSQRKQTETCEEGSPQEKCQEPEGERPEGCVQAAPPDAERSPGSGSRAAEAAVQQGHESDSPQLEPLEAEGETFPDATTAAKQLHSSLGNSSGQENASLGAGREQEPARGARGVPGSPAGEQSADRAARLCAQGGSPEHQDAPSQPPKDASAPAGNRPAEGAENQTGSAPGNSKADPPGRDCRPRERAHPAKVLTLDIYLSKTEVARVDEPVVISPGAEDCGDCEDMEKRSSGRRSGRRRRSQKSTDSPGADPLPPDFEPRNDAVFDNEVAPNAAAENGSAEKKVKSPPAAPDGGVAAVSGLESKPSPDPKGQPLGESERSKQPPPASSPAKRRGRSHVPEAVPTSPAGGPRAPAKDSLLRRASGPGPAAKESGEEAARVIHRKLMVKSSSLPPEIKPKPKRGPLPNLFDGRGEGSRSKELGRSVGGSDADGLKPRNHFGGGRWTVTTTVTIPAKPKHVELNLKTPKNLGGLGNGHNPLSQPVHKGNTATKISLFENKQANSPRHTDLRGARNTPASNKTFVGRAQLNLAKKAKEMERPEKKLPPDSHQNGALGKEASAEARVTVPEEETPGSPLNQGDKVDGQTDAGCPSEPVVAALMPVKDHELLGEDDSKAADRKRLERENMTDTAQDSPAVLEAKDSPPTAIPKPQDEFSDSQHPAGSSNGPSLSLAAPIPVDDPKDTGAQAPVSSFLCTDLKVSENHNGCTLPVSHQNNEMMSPSRLAGGGGGERSPPLSPEHSLAAMGNECPSKVLVQVRSFMLPGENTKDVRSGIISDSSEVREAQLPSYHNKELEVVSVASRTPQKEEVQGNKSTSPKHIHCTEEHVAKSGPQVMLPESEKTLPIQGNGKPLKTESSTTNYPGNRNHLETPQRPNQNVVNGQDSPASLLNISAGSDDSVFDSSSDMEKFTEIIKKMDSAVCVPQKKKKARMPNSPAPHFAMPPIHEDNLEKVFDPNVFTFGLGKKKEGQPEMSLALHWMQNLDTKSKLRPKRSSTEQSVLFKSLQTRTNGKGEPLAAPEVNDKENRDVTNGGVKRSRLEKSALFSSILSSLPQDKIFSPSVTSVNTMTTSFNTAHNSSLSRPSVLQPVAEGAPPCGSEKEQPSLPPSNVKVFNFNSSDTSHSGLESPSSVEKYLQKEETGKDLDSRSNLPVPKTTYSEFSKLQNSGDMEKANHIESVLKSNLPSYGSSDTDFPGLFKSTLFDPSISFSEMSLSDTTTLKGSVQNKINPRPGKVVIYGEPDVSEECIEVFSDIEDCSSWSLSPVILIKVVRGCWIFYEKPNFEGHSIPLEEGELELSGLWDIEDILERNDDEAESAKPVVIGSIRLVVRDYRVSQIDLFTEPEGLGLLNSYFDDIEEMQGFGMMQKTCSIKVHWGTWLIYEEPGFQGVPFILEPGEYPDLSFWDTEEAYIGSMRPLKMGGRKVEFPIDPKVVIYEKPFFEGKCVELEKEVCNFIMEGGETTGNEHLPLTSVGSMKVLRGIWVAYEKPGFTGHQYLLEEGEYKDWNDWGGYSGELQSLRPVLGDFSNAHMIMYNEKNFGSKGSSIDVLGIVADLKETGYGVKTQSVNVLSGVWVAYENPDFTGEQYILDKGFYTSFEDWGGKNCKISSVQPICLDSFTRPGRQNQIHLFSEPQFQGRSQCFEETTSQIDESFSAKSCRVLGGSWVAYDGENFSGNQYVLEEGHYPSLSAMGCLPEATFKSVRFVDVELSEPTIILFEREDFKGKKIEFSTEIVNLQSLGFNTRIRSVQVIGGIWVTYEYGNYRGRQFLLSPAEVPNWYEFSGCRQIGSLRPFVQKRIYFRLRNKATGLFMSTNGNLEDLKLLRIQVMEDVGADDQIWMYQEGCFKCRIAEDCCLTIVGNLVTSGSKLGLALEQNIDSQFWSMKSDGRLYSKLKPNLVLDIKGGTQYDQNHLILNSVSKEKSTQVWEAMVL